MPVLVLSKLANATGNNSTAGRIRDHLVDLGYKCLFKCVTQFQCQNDLEEFVKSEGIKAIIGIHAFRAGKLLAGSSCPFAIVFGGTDLNENFRDKDRLATMTTSVKEARSLIAFTDAMRRKATWLWPDIAMKMIVQPQAVVSCQPSDFSFQQYLRDTFGNQHSIVNNNMVIFLLVSGLRPVKDPLYLIETFSEWHIKDDRIYLIVIGPVLDEKFADLCGNIMDSAPGVLFMKPLAHNDLLAAIKYSFALVNTSKSEGMASAILEAMSLGTPVIARHNEGNCAILDHRGTGLIFNSKEEFQCLAKELLDSEELQNYIVENAKQKILMHHSYSSEAPTYQRIVKNLLQGNGETGVSSVGEDSSHCS